MCDAITHTLLIISEWQKHCLFHILFSGWCQLWMCFNLSSRYFAKGEISLEDKFINRSLVTTMLLSGLQAMSIISMHFITLLYTILSETVAAIDMMIGSLIHHDANLMLTDFLILGNHCILWFCSFVSCKLHWQRVHLIESQMYC